jgi:L-ascorbate 6-phosphate lactonase
LLISPAWPAWTGIDSKGSSSPDPRLLAALIQLDGPTELIGTFALPTDNTDLNHIGVLIRFANGIIFYNIGDTGYCEQLDSLLPRGVDLCTICINGGFHNFDPLQAARVVKAISPIVAIPCHYDMMINNIGHPDMLRTALGLVGSKAQVQVLDYYHSWVFRMGQRADGLVL